MYSFFFIFPSVVPINYLFIENTVDVILYIFKYFLSFNFYCEKCNAMQCNAIQGAYRIIILLIVSLPRTNSNLTTK